MVGMKENFVPLHIKKGLKKAESGKMRVKL